MLFKRISFKKGRGSAITATARKIAVIIWNMIVKKQHYMPINTDEYLQEMKIKKTIQIKKMNKSTESKLFLYQYLKKAGCNSELEMTTTAELIHHLYIF